MLLKPPPSFATLAEWGMSFEDERRESSLTISKLTFQEYRQRLTKRDIVGQFGPTSTTRDLLYWVASQPFGDPGYLPTVWPIVWQLIKQKELILDEPLRTLLDRDNVAHDVYRLLWEARFNYKESGTEEAYKFAKTLIRWVSTPLLSGQDLENLALVGIQRVKIEERDQIDLLFTLLTLGQINDFFDRCFWYFQGSSKHPLVLTAMEQWLKEGPIPIGLVYER